MSRHTQYRPPRSSTPPTGRPFELRIPTAPDVPHYKSVLTPVSFLLRAALTRPTKLAIVHPERGYHFTYEEWAARVLSLTMALLHVPGWKRGDRVAMICPNVPMMADAHYAVLAAGGILTPLNYRNSKKEIHWILQHCQPSVIMVDEQYVDLVPLDVPSSVKVVVSKDSGGQDPSDAYEAFLDEGYQHWQASNRSGPLDWLAVPPVQEEDATCSLCYTSGTTGHPKGVETTLRGSYLSALSNVIESNVTGESVYLWVLPMFHCCGWTFPWAMSAAMGTQYMLRSVNYDRIWDALLHGGVTHYSGAPTVQLGVVNHPKACRLPQRVCVTVAASAPTATLLRRMESLNLLPMHLYGLTETYGPSCRRFFEPAWLALPIEERAKEQAKQGHAYVTGDEVRVVRRDVPPGQPLQDVARDGKELGEIVMRGNIVMKQYYKDPTATSNATHGNYFHTGDLAVRHPGGEVQILDRGKDIIISGGENVSSLMVEEELAAHPWIEECAVVARPDPKWGECVHAFVKLSAVGRQTLADQGAKKTEMLSSEVTAFCRVKMSGFAVPKWFTILDELPKSSTGKIQKKDLRTRVAKL